MGSRIIDLKKVPIYYETEGGLVKAWVSKDFDPSVSPYSFEPRIVDGTAVLVIRNHPDGRPVFSFGN